VREGLVRRAYKVWAGIAVGVFVLVAMGDLAGRLAGGERRGDDAEHAVGDRVPDDHALPRPHDDRAGPCRRCRDRHAGRRPPGRSGPARRGLHRRLLREEVVVLR
jgi:hypothetical protein